jgi:biopolymer transport protein TolR
MPAVSTRSRGRRTISEINMVPFIDVMLVLLIIFMVTAPLITVHKIDLPNMGNADRQPDQKIEILITKDETLEMKLADRSQRLTLAEVAAAVQREQAGRAPSTSAVVISADRNVKYEIVVRVMDTLQRAGVQRVGLSVQLVP